MMGKAQNAFLRREVGLGPKVGANSSGGSFQEVGGQFGDLRNASFIFLPFWGGGKFVCVCFCFALESL